MQKGDVKVTSSNCKALEDWINYKPSTKIILNAQKKEKSNSPILVMHAQELYGNSTPK